MAETDFVFAVHNETKIVSSIPVSYLTLFDVFTELTDADIAALREEEVRRMTGTATVEPSLKWKKEQLVDFAEERGIEIDTTATKAEVLEAISTQEGVN